MKERWMILKNNSQDRICIIDGYCGIGKTSWAIQEINNLPSNSQIMFITPYLDEVKRIIGACKEKNFVQPDKQLGSGRKASHLLKLVLAGENIVSTHALFMNVDDELINALRENNYILFLDEVFQPIDKWHIAPDRINNKDEITKRDVISLIDREIIKANEDYTVKWVYDNIYLSQYVKLQNLADRNMLYLNNSMLMWSFPIDMFKEDIFPKIYIMTHRFKSQIQSYYYDYFKLSYGLYSVYNENGKYQIILGQTDETAWQKKMGKKIHILENHKINNIGSFYYDPRSHPYKSALSYSWYDKSPDVAIVRKNANNYFQNIQRCPAKERMWTCFKKNISDIKGDYVSPKNHVSLNTRATNDYQDKKVLAYLVNRFPDPFYDSFFFKRGIRINRDEYALSEMLQWIFRSAIRNDQDIHIYIPAERMRNLLINYLK